MTHAALVTALAKPGEEIKANLSSLDCHILHMLIGLSGEAGELIDAIKKPIIYRKPIDIGNVLEEMGDIEFYLEGLRQAFNLDREKILQTNIEKLEIRYGHKYSDTAANERKDKQYSGTEIQANETNLTARLKDKQ
jgi:NTP pyrophosphatase (non-canonical NTP hydrolase)